MCCVYRQNYPETFCIEAQRHSYGKRKINPYLLAHYSFAVTLMDKQFQSFTTRGSFLPSTSLVTLSTVKQLSYLCSGQRHGTAAGVLNPLNFQLLSLSLRVKLYLSYTQDNFELTYIRNVFFTSLKQAETTSFPMLQS